MRIVRFADGGRLLFWWSRDRYARFVANRIVRNVSLRSLATADGRVFDAAAERVSCVSFVGSDLSLSRDLHQIVAFQLLHLFIAENAVLSDEGHQLEMSIELGNS